MTNLSVNFDNIASAEILPQRIPDLYNSEPVILALKSKTPVNSIQLQGSRALSPWSASLNISQAKNSKGIASFWARKKIESLMDNIHGNVNKQKARKQITDIALKHHLVSKYTSLVAVDITPSSDMFTPLKKHKLAVNLPHGQNNHTQSREVFQRLPQTATNAELHFFFGCCLLILGLLSQLIHQASFRSKLKKWHLL